MSSSILQIILRVTKEGTGNKELQREAKELKASLQDLGLGSLASVTALGAMSGAVIAAASFTRQAVDETVKYAGEIKNLSQITGESAEETSRVVQTLDDFKLTTEDLTKAQKALAEEGLSLNIETLARLSDEYKTLGSGAEKTQFLIDKFGKTGLKFADAMSKGGPALRDMADAIDDSLIMTEEGIRQAEEYRLAVDELGDEWMGFKISVGQQVIPELTRILSEFNENHKSWFQVQQPEHLRGSVAMTREYAEKLKAEMASLDKPLDSAGRSYQAMAAAMEQGAKGGVAAGTDAIEEQEAALKAASKANQDYLNLVGNFTSVYETESQRMNDIAAQRMEIERELNADLAAGWNENSTRIQEHRQKLAELATAEQDAANAANRAMRERILTMLETRLAVDGLSDTEMNYLLELGQQWGVYSSEAVTAAQRAMAEVNKLSSAIISLPDGRTIRINLDVGTTYQETGSKKGKGGDGGYERDSGGPGIPGQAVLVGIGAQPELFVPNEPGMFYPAGAYGVNTAGGSQAGNVTIMLGYSPMFSTADQDEFETKMLPMMRSAWRRIGAGG